MRKKVILISALLTLSVAVIAFLAVQPFEKDYFCTQVKSCPGLVHMGDGTLVSMNCDFPHSRTSHLTFFLDSVARIVTVFLVLALVFYASLRSLTALLRLIARRKEEANASGRWLERISGWILILASALLPLAIIGVISSVGGDPLSQWEFGLLDEFEQQLSNSCYHEK